MSKGIATILHFPKESAPWRYAVTIESGTDKWAFRSVVAAIKREIPSEYRRWDRTTKHWVLQRDEDLNQVVELLRARGVTVLERPPLDDDDFRSDLSHGHQE